MKNNDDNLGQEVMEAMDGIRQEVWFDGNVQPHWRDRLTDTAGLRKQQQNSGQFISEFQRRNCVDAEAARLGDHPTLAVIFGDALDDLMRRQRELEFQRQWIIAASSAHAFGSVRFARRLAHVYRLLYGGDLDYEPVEHPIRFKTGRVIDVASELEHRVWGRQLKYHEWHDSDFQFFDIAHERMVDQRTRIQCALERRGLLHNPFRSEIGRRLQVAYRALEFRHSQWLLDRCWLCQILGALDGGNTRLASYLMRLYSYRFGVIFLIEGQSLDWPAHGTGHIPDDPSEQQVKRCLFECNRLRAAWVERYDGSEWEAPLNLL